MSDFQLHAFLPYRLSQLAERVSRSLAQTYSREFNLSVAEWRVLATLASAPAIQAREVARRTNLDKVQVSRAVARLRERALLTRQRNAGDQRALDLSLTGAGRALFEQIAPRALAWEARVLEGLPAADRAALGRALTLLEGRIEQIEREEAPGAASAAASTAGQRAAVADTAQGAPADAGMSSEAAHSAAL